MTLVADFNSSVNVPFQRMRALLGEAGGGLQAGVIGPGDLKVSQRAAGANMSVDVAVGAAWVAITTGTRNGLGHVYSDAIANVTVTASNATNPRIDQILLRWNDSNIPTGSGNAPTLEVLTGTATAGATLDNRTGAAALPNDCLRLADILVPATSTSVTTANIRDRRPWARGAYFRGIRTAGAQTTASTTMGVIDTVNLQGRIECSGAAMVRLTILGRCWSNTVDQGVGFITRMDNIDQGPQGIHYSNGANLTAGSGVLAWTEVLPAAGSHVFEPFWNSTIGTATANLASSSGDPTFFVIQEIVRPNANNN